MLHTAEKNKIREFYNKEEWVSVISHTDNVLLDTANQTIVQLVLHNKAMQRLIAICETIRATSFKYTEWEKWYSQLQDESNILDTDLKIDDIISKFDISVIQNDTNEIKMISSVAEMYRMIILTEATIHDTNKANQYLNDSSRFLSLKEISQLGNFLSEHDTNFALLFITDLYKKHRKLYYAPNIKRVSIESELLQMIAPERFRPTTVEDNEFEGKNPFESDYFRVVTSAPIRRLQDKTQIFPQEKSDFVRRRLTHSMEVAAIGRHLGRMVEERLIEDGFLLNNGEYIKNFKHSIATILETAGLVHDIGNPPFGHFGEDTIQTYFKKLKGEQMQNRLKLQTSVGSFQIKKESTGEEKIELLVASLQQACKTPIDKIAKAFIDLDDEKSSDFTNFDGNVQSFRILRHLGLSADNNSFNLTMPTLATIIKYPFPAKHNKIAKNHSSKKSGYYQSEKDAYEKICQTLHLRQGKRHPLSYLLEAADDIVNVTSDVEDGYKMGIISFNEITKAIDTLNITELKSDTIKQFVDDQVKRGGCSVDATNELYIKEFRIRAVHHLLQETVDIFIENTHAIMYDSYATDDNNTPAQHQDNPILGNELLQNSKLRKALSKLQSKTYDDCNVLKSELLGEHVITEMLNKFIGCMFSQDVKTKKENDEEKHILETKSAAGKLYALISPNYKRAFNCQQDEVPKDSYQRFQLAVDYISGMTDSYIVDLYNELTNSKY